MYKLPMMSMTAVALLLAGCVSQEKYNESQQNLAASQQQNSDLEQEYQQLNQSMSAEVSAQQMQITRLQNAVRVSVDNALLFPSGGWEMSAQAKQSIAKISAILAPHLRTKINVNGYTDTTPIGPGLMQLGITSNLILSQKRADDVAQYMISQGVKPSLITAQGFGDANPVASNATEAGRAQNRRVELTLSNASG
jgi:chemotaxis protein MotB